jgi:hypothetical protein
MRPHIWRMATNVQSCASTWNDVDLNFSAAWEYGLYESVLNSTRRALDAPAPVQPMRKHGRVDGNKRTNNTTQDERGVLLQTLYEYNAYDASYTHGGMGTVLPGQTATKEAMMRIDARLTGAMRQGSCAPTYRKHRSTTA